MKPIQLIPIALIAATVCWSTALANQSVKTPDTARQFAAYTQALQSTKPNWLHTRPVKVVSCHMQGVAELEDGSTLLVPWEPPLNKELLIAYSIETGSVITDPQTGFHTPYCSRNPHPIDVLSSDNDCANQDTASTVIGQGSISGLWLKEIDRVYRWMELVLPKTQVEESQRAWAEYLNSTTALALSCYEKSGTQCTVEYASARTDLIRDHARKLNAYLIQRLWNIVPDFYGEGKTE